MLFLQHCKIITGLYSIYLFVWIVAFIGKFTHQKTEITFFVQPDSRKLFAMLINANQSYPQNQNVMEQKLKYETSILCRGEITIDCFCVSIFFQIITRLEIFSTISVQNISHLQLPWLDVRKEMVEEKGLDPSVADRIGVYVKLKGGMALVEQLTNDEQLYKNSNAKAGLDDIRLLLEFIELYQISDKVSLVIMKCFTGI